MANAEGQKIEVKTEGLSENGLLGDFKASKSNAPATVADVERIVDQVRQSFEKFTQQQLTYAQKTAADASKSASATTGEQASETSAASPTAASGGGASTTSGDGASGTSGKASDSAGGSKDGEGSGDAGGITGKFNKAVSWMKDKVTGIIPKDFKGKMTKGLGTFTSLFSSKALVIGTLTVVVLAALKSALSNPVMLLVLVMVGTYLYKMFLASHVNKFLDMFKKFKAAWDKMGDFDFFQFILTLRTIYENLIKPLAGFIVSVKSNLEKIRKGIARAKETLADFWENLKAQWKRMWDGGIVGALEETWKTMKEIATTMWNGAVASAKELGKWIGDFFRDNWDDIVMTLRKGLAGLPVVGKFFGTEASINADRIAELDESGKKIEDERKELVKALGKAKGDDEKKEIQGKLDENEADRRRFVERAKRFKLTDVELEEARNELAKGGRKMYGAYSEAIGNRGSFDTRSAAQKDSNFDFGASGGGKVSAAVGEGGVKTFTLTAAQGDEMEKRIRKVFGKNLERMKASTEKKGVSFDEKAAIKSLEEKLLAGLDRLSDRTEDLSKRQLSDDDLKRAMSLAARSGGSRAAATTVVVQNPEPTPPRSTPGR